MMRKLMLFEYRCASCGHAHRAPALPPGSYGEFLLRSEGNGTEALLNALSDPVYDEVDGIIQRHPKLRGLTRNQQAQVLRLVFGVSCDLDEDGSLFRIGLNPRCPICGNRDITFWQATEPPIVIEKDLPLVTHENWQKLGPTQKKQLVNSELRRLSLV